MTRLSRSVALLLPLVVLPACSGGGIGELETFEDRAGYAIGLDVGRSLKNANVEINVEAFIQGMRDAMAGGDSLMTAEAAMAAIMEFQQKAQEAQETARVEEGNTNRTEGETYLAENGQREGVITTESGLQYRVVVQGEGPVPTPESQVRVHYRGTFINGEQFDSSYDRGEPAVFGVTQVIPGWTEVLQLMPVGSKFEVAIPGNLAYGPMGPPNIGPDRTLLFEIELLGIESGT